MLFSVLNLCLPSPLGTQFPPFLSSGWTAAATSLYSACVVEEGRVGTLPGQSTSGHQPVLKILFELPECLSITVFLLWNLDGASGAANSHQFPQERKNRLKSQRPPNETRFACLKQKSDMLLWFLTHLHTGNVKWLAIYKENWESKSSLYFRISQRFMSLLRTGDIKQVLSWHRVSKKDLTSDVASYSILVETCLLLPNKGSSYIKGVSMFKAPSGMIPHAGSVMGHAATPLPHHE